MIPKVIHYCWFGDKPKGEKEIKCINSWKKFCPDYEIKEWNETNVDLTKISYVRQAYDVKKYAFVSDVVRLLVLEEYGGIYLDTDVQLIKSLSPLLDNKCFAGFENSQYVNSGQILASEPNVSILGEVLASYKETDFILEDKTFNLTGCPIFLTDVLVKNGLVLNNEIQSINGFTVYPSDYFNPYDDATGRLNVTQNTYSIHWYSKSWLDAKAVRRSDFTRIIHRIFGVNSLSWIKKILGKK